MSARHNDKAESNFSSLEKISMALDPDPTSFLTFCYTLLLPTLDEERGSLNIGYSG